MVRIFLTYATGLTAFSLIFALCVAIERPGMYNSYSFAESFVGALPWLVHVSEVIEYLIFTLLPLGVILKLLKGWRSNKQGLQFVAAASVYAIVAFFLWLAAVT